MFEERASLLPKPIVHSLQMTEESRGKESDVIMGGEMSEGVSRLLSDGVLWLISLRLLRMFAPWRRDTTTLVCMSSPLELSTMKSWKTLQACANHQPPRAIFWGIGDEHGSIRSMAFWSAYSESMLQCPLASPPAPSPSAYLVPLEPPPLHLALPPLEALASPS